MGRTTGTPTRPWYSRLPPWVKRPLKEVLYLPLVALARGSTLATYKPGRAPRVCPICGADGSVPLRDEPVTRHFMLYDHRPWARWLVQTLGIDPLVNQATSGRWSVRYMRCLHCGNGYQDFPHSSETVEKYYMYLYKSGGFRHRGDIH